MPSGGRATETDIGTFLGGGERHPEHQALLHLLERRSGPVLAPIIPDGDEALASARSESFAKTRPKPAKTSWKMARPADQALAECGTAGMTDGRQGASSGTWSSINS